MSKPLLNKDLVIKDIIFVPSFYHNSDFICPICKEFQLRKLAVIFYPCSEIISIFKEKRFCLDCAIKLIENPTKTIFEFNMGLL